MSHKKRKNSRKNTNLLKSIIGFIIIILFAGSGYYLNNNYPAQVSEAMSFIENTLNISNSNNDVDSNTINHSTSYSLTEIPAYSGSPYVVLNNNIPNFTSSDETNVTFESYSNLDSLDRCGVAFANLGIETMPTEDRGSISHIKPSGWQSVEYDIVDGKYLYNRCHLIGFQLSSENANDKNLITGTRYFNVDGMLPFENEVAEYIENTKNHVLYRVTPIYEGNNLVANGVQIEAKSVEDNGSGIQFNVYIYNVQPGISIDYSNGNSSLDT